MSGSATGSGATLPHQVCGATVIGNSHPIIPNDQFFNMLASAELYDASTGAFTQTGT